MYDNSGARTSPHPNQSQPIISQTAQQLKVDNGDSGTATVVAGTRYRFTSMIKGGFVFGLATVAAGNEANIRWSCPIYNTVEIQIPLGYTTLYYTSDTDNDAAGYLVAIKQNADPDAAE